MDTKGAMAISFGKKPFDWMTDTQWQMLLVSDWDKKTVFETLDCQLLPLQMVASHFGWIHEVLERMGKDGKETVWRTVGEGVAPEMINLAEGIGCK